MIELRKQSKSTEKIEVIEKTPFKIDRWNLIKKAKQLQKENPEFYFWVFTNQETAKKK